MPSLSAAEAQAKASNSYGCASHEGPSGNTSTGTSLLGSGVSSMPQLDRGQSEKCERVGAAVSSGTMEPSAADRLQRALRWVSNMHPDARDLYDSNPVFRHIIEMAGMNGKPYTRALEEALVAYDNQLIELRKKCSTSNSSKTTKQNG